MAGHMIQQKILKVCVATGQRSNKKKDASKKKDSKREKGEKGYLYRGEN